MTMKASIKDGVIYSPYPRCDIPPVSIYTAVKTCLENKPEKISVVDDHLCLTRRQFLDRIRRYAVGFQARGIGPGDTVCAYLSNSVENFVAMYGVAFSGATVMLAKTSLTEQELYYQMKDGDATHVLTEAQYAEKVLKVHARLRLQGLFVTGTSDGFESVSGFAELDGRDYEELAVSDPAETVAALAYTSGTTGLPKGVEISHRSFVANLHTSKSHVSTNDEDVLLAWNPITQPSGFLFTMVAACVGSTCVIVSPALRFEQIVDYVDRYKVTTLASFPTRIRQIVGEMRRRGTRLRGVRRINVGGGIISPLLAEAVSGAFEDLLCLRNSYGMTESCGIVCTSPVDAISAGNMGYPATMVEIKVEDPKTGAKLGPNKNGELCYKIPSVMKGYYKKPEATAAFIDEDGWCHSGDLCYYDERGRLYFVERLKEVIRCMDQQIAPAELEDHIMTSLRGHVAEVAVAGVPHSEYGEAAAAYVVLAPSSREKLAKEDLIVRIKDAVAGVFAPHKHLHGGVHFVDGFPRTETGKVKRNFLRQLSLAQAEKEMGTSTKEP
ncbi:uncharacterized protein LOC144158363 [Haemaphysalis longicornis]